MFTKNFSKTIAIFALGLICFTAFGSNLHVSAQKIGVKPYNPQGQSRGVFRFILSPDQEASDSITVANSSEDGGDVTITAKDSLIDNVGQMGFIDNSLPNKASGSWLTLDKEKLSVKPNSVEKVDFKVKVPNGTPAGDYAAGITSTISGSTVRTAITVYITVKGELRVDNQIKDLSIVNPKQENFAKELDLRGFIKPENMVIKYTAKNKGNVFSVLNGNIKLTSPSGKTTDFALKRTLNLNSTNEDVYLETNLPYEIGQTKVKMDYDSKPYNITNELPVAISDQSKGSLEYTLDTAQQDLDRFKSTRDNLNAIMDSQVKTTLPNNSSSSSVSSVVSSKSSSENSKKEEKKDEGSYVTGGLIVISLLVLVIAYLVYKEYKDGKEKKARQETKKPEIEEKKVAEKKVEKSEKLEVKKTEEVSEKVEESSDKKE